MDYLVLVAIFFGAAFATNAVPHLSKGLTGAPFQTPFARPPGVGLSPARTNVLWGMVNVVVAWLLLVPVAGFVAGHWPHALAFGLGMLAMGLLLARVFGRLHGGSEPPP